VVLAVAPKRCDVMFPTGERTYPEDMGLLDWLDRTVGKDLDRRVSGAEGTAQGRFDRLDDEAALQVQARLGEGQHGTLVLRARGEGAPQEARGSGSARLDLGPGKPWRGGTVIAEADVTGATAATLAIVTMEISGGERQTYSVEARPDQQGAARLTLTVELG
jgi:hypothetical protein